MASVEPRETKNGTVYRAVVRLPGGGKKTATRDTEREAWAWAENEERLKEINSTTSAAQTGVKVEEMLLCFNEDIASKTDSEKWNNLRIMKWCKDPIATLPVVSVTTHEINQWIDRGMKSGLAGATVNRELNLLSSAFNYAVKVRRWITVNPCHGAMRPERGRPRNRPLLKPEQVQALCIAAGLDRDPNLATLTARMMMTFLIAMETGMRSGEILRVKPDHYWPDKSTVFVAAQERGGRKASRSGRATTDPSRKVALTTRAIELWDRLLATMPADQPYIVGLDDKQRDSLWRKTRDMAGLKEADIRFHDMKHEAATRLAPYLDVLALSHTLGTKDIRLLRDTYYTNDASATASRLPAKLAPI